MEKLWLANYDPGVPAEIDLKNLTSLNDILRQSCDKYTQKPAYSNMGRTLSYIELRQLSEAFAAYLQQGLGLKKGDRVAIMMPNLLQYPVALFGSLLAGMVVVNVNPMYTPRELKHQLNDSNASAIIILENFASTLGKIRNDVDVKHIVTTQIGDMLAFPKSVITNFVVKRIKKMIPKFSLDGTVDFKRALQIGAKKTLQSVDVQLSDLAFLQYTGGTTGVAKGAMLSHGNMVSNVLQSQAWLAGEVSEGAEVIITALPLYHIFSLTANCLSFMRFGGENVLITNPRDFSGFVAELKKHKFTAFTGVNTLFNSLLHTPGFDQIDFSNLKLTLGGGMAVQKAVAEEWAMVTGKVLIEAYGLTETSPAACINPMSLKKYNGSIGLPISSTSVSIRNDQGEKLPLGEIGEICIKGPQVMQGYWQKEEATAEVMTVDGALRTGDLGRMDEGGFTYLTDRKKDMIIVSGFNVYPNEIEGVLVMHPGIVEAAAIGVPNEKSGELIKVFVVCSDDNLTTDDIKAFCKEQLTGYKVPKEIEICHELPKSNVGKILRRELRDQELAKLK